METREDKTNQMLTNRAKKKSLYFALSVINDYTKEEAIDILTEEAEEAEERENKLSKELFL